MPLHPSSVQKLLALRVTPANMRQIMEVIAFEQAEYERIKENQRDRTRKCRDKQKKVTPVVTLRQAQPPCIDKGKTLDNLETKLTNTAPKRKATRISPDWRPSPADRQFALAEGVPDERIEYHAASFVDYWLGIAGTKGCKLDWPATWRNHIRMYVAPKYSIPAKPSLQAKGRADLEFLRTEYLDQPQERSELGASNHRPVPAKQNGHAGLPQGIGQFALQLSGNDVGSSAGYNQAGCSAPISPRFAHFQKNSG